MHEGRRGADKHLFGYSIVRLTLTVYARGRYFVGWEAVSRETQVYTRISADDNVISVQLGEVLRYRDLILLFVKRGFVVTYTQTILGPLWLLFRPLITSVMYLFVFGGIARIGTQGVPGILFYMAGNAMWSYFSSSLGGNASTFTSNAGLFGKVYFPRLMVPIANVISSMPHFCINMLLFGLVYAWFLYQGLVVPSALALVMTPVLLVVLGAMGLGMGIIFSSLTTRYRDLTILVGFGLSLWMYATPVVYPLASISNETLRTIVLLNPVTMPMELFRLSLFGTGTIVWWSVAISVAFTSLVLFLGARMFARVEKTFIDTV